MYYVPRLLENNERANLDGLSANQASIIFHYQKLHYMDTYTVTICLEGTPHYIKCCD